MKKCSYCGAEYPDDAKVCVIDQTPFHQTHFAERPIVASTPKRKIPMSLSIVSCYLIASGIFQIVWGIMLAQYIGNVPVLNIIYAVLILFIARGLRRCSRRWYVCALVVIGLIISSICLEIVQGFTNAVSMRSMILYFKDFGIWLCIILVLTRPVIRDLFTISLMSPPNTETGFTE